MAKQEEKFKYLLNMIYVDGKSILVVTHFSTYAYKTAENSMQGFSSLTTCSPVNRKHKVVLYTYSIRSIILI